MDYDNLIFSDDDTLPANSALQKGYDLTHRFGESTGIDLLITQRMGDLLKAAGYTDIDCQTFKIPYGQWAKVGAVSVLDE